MDSLTPLRCSGRVAQSEKYSQTTTITLGLQATNPIRPPPLSSSTIWHTNPQSFFWWHLADEDGLRWEGRFEDHRVGLALRTGVFSHPVLTVPLYRVSTTWPSCSWTWYLHLSGRSTSSPFQRLCGLSAFHTSRKMSCLSPHILLSDWADSFRQQSSARDQLEAKAPELSCPRRVVVDVRTVVANWWWPSCLDFHQRVLRPCSEAHLRASRASG